MLLNAETNHMFSSGCLLVHDLDCGHDKTEMASHPIRGLGSGEDVRSITSRGSGMDLYVHVSDEVMESTRPTSASPGALHRETRKHQK